MGDRIRVQLPLRIIYLSLTNHPSQLSLAIPPWVGAMSTSQRAVMPCDWGVKADMVLFAGNTVWSISERVRCVCVDALYKSMFTLLYMTGLELKCYLWCGFMYSRAKRVLRACTAMLVTLAAANSQSPATSSSDWRIITNRALLKYTSSAAEALLLSTSRETRPTRQYLQPTVARFYRLYTLHAHVLYERLSLIPVSQCVNLLIQVIGS